MLDQWHLSETQFANLFLPVISGFVIGAWLSGRMAGRVPATRQSQWGFACQLVGATLTVALHALIKTPPLLRTTAIDHGDRGRRAVGVTHPLTAYAGSVSQGARVRGVGAILCLDRDLGSGIRCPGAAGERIAADAQRNVLVRRADWIRTVASRATSGIVRHQ